MIKNLVFDVGGVLIGYRCLEMLQDYGLSLEEARRVADVVFENDMWTHGMDMGMYTVEQVIEKYREAAPEDILIIEWFLRNAELMVIPRPRVWAQVERLKWQGYRIYLLSNYSKELFERHTGGASFLEVLDGAVVSYQVQLVKPDIRIYRELLNKYNLNPAESLFFDDRLENAKAAMEAGMQAFHVESEEGLLCRLAELESENTNTRG